jgi:hypothetical protein
MATAPTNQPGDPNLVPISSEPPALWRRLLAVAAAVLFLISLAFPVTAGLSHDTESFPKWWGTLDVAIAFILGLLAFVVFAVAGGNVDKQVEDACYRAYRMLLHGILALCVVIYLGGDRIVWPNCATGLAWRTWLLLYSLPAWLTVFGVTPGLGGPFRS